MTKKAPKKKVSKKKVVKKTASKQRAPKKVAKKTATKKGVEKDQLGRPTVYTKEIANKVLIRMYEGESLRQICRDLQAEGTDLKESTVRCWAADDRDGFGKRYDRAQELRMDAISDEILDIADDGTNDWIEREYQNGRTEIVLNGEHVQRSKLRIDTRKFLLAKLAAAKFGDRLEVHSKKSIQDATDDELIEAVTRHLEGAGEDGASVLTQILEGLGMGVPAVPKGDS